MTGAKLAALGIVACVIFGVAGIILFHVSDSTSYRQILEYGYFWSAISIVAISTFAVIFGREQLMLARKDHQQSIRMQNAQTFLEVEERWNSESMVEGRVAGEAFLIDLRRSSVQDLDSTIVERLNGMRNSPSEQDHYVKIMKPVMYFETVGLMCRADRNYVDIRDVFDLIGPSLEEYDVIVGPYIRYEFEKWSKGLRESATNPPPSPKERPDGPMGNAINLIDSYLEFSELQRAAARKTLNQN